SVIPQRMSNRLYAPTPTVPATDGSPSEESLTGQPPAGPFDLGALRSAESEAAARRLGPPPGPERASGSVSHRPVSICRAGGPAREARAPDGKINRADG